MFIITEYEIDEMKIIKCQTELMCPTCGRILSPKGHTDRTVREPGGEATVYYLENRICKYCNQKHTLVPNFLSPRYLWGVATMVEYITGDPNKLIDGPDDKTVARWKKAIAEGRLVIDFEKKIVISVS